MSRLAALVLFLLPIPAFAGTVEDDLTACFLIDAPLARLQCYDALADRPDLPSGIGSGPSAANAWQVSDTTSPIDGVRRVALFRQSLDLGALDGGSALLALRCRQGRTSVIVAVPAFVSSDDELATVLYRVGDTEPASEVWTVSEGRYLFAPEGSGAEALIRRMARADDLAMRVPAADGRSLEFHFGLGGLDRHVGVLAEACSWPDHAG